ncbi:hypothetical protein JCM33374_g2214 [Metschnikowia sp. JCM 33374]|nr:hypothetical protein JCM33374_g2214 [Metschnikowia sp. JCM 33374]
MQIMKMRLFPGIQLPVKLNSLTQAFLTTQNEQNEPIFWINYPCLKHLPVDFYEFVGSYGSLSRALLRAECATLEWEERVFNEAER